MHEISLDVPERIFGLGFQSSADSVDFFGITTRNGYTLMMTGYHRIPTLLYTGVRTHLLELRDVA